VAQFTLFLDSQKWVYYSKPFPVAQLSAGVLNRSLLPVDSTDYVGAQSCPYFQPATKLSKALMLVHETLHPTSSWMAIVTSQRISGQTWES
jgi:hypothetical protein